MITCDLCGTRCSVSDAVRLCMEGGAEVPPMYCPKPDDEPLHLCHVCRDGFIFPVMRKLVAKIRERQPGEIEKFDLMTTLAAAPQPEPA